MAQTDRTKLVYPTLGDAPNAEAAFLAMGESVEDRIAGAVATEAALASVPTPYAGMRVYVTAEDLFYQYTGAAWRSEAGIFIHHRNNASGEELTIGSNNTWYNVPWPSLSYERGGAYTYNTPDGSFTYAGKWAAALMVMDGFLQVNGTVSGTHSIRVRRLLAGASDTDANWQQFAAFTYNADVSHPFSAQFLVGVGDRFRVEFRKTAGSGNTVGGAASANRCMVEARRY